ncbi:MAG: protein-tyrosine phosphatase family protein, partial [Polyangiaceae bacterium]
MPEGASISRIESWLARGGQPVRDDYGRLYESGIRLVVNLRKNHDEAADIERHAPRLTSLRIPVRNDRAPSDEQAEKWLALCEAARGQLPIYVHCHEGHGRTSVFCGLVRIAQGWDLE